MFKEQETTKEIYKDTRVVKKIIELLKLNKLNTRFALSNFSWNFFLSSWNIF